MSYAYTQLVLIVPTNYMSVNVHAPCSTLYSVLQVLVSEAGRVSAELRLQERQAGGSGELHNNNNNTDNNNIFEGERHPESRPGLHAGHLPHHHRRLPGQPRQQRHGHQVLQVWNHSRQAYNVGLFLIELYSSHAQTTLDVVCSQESLSYLRCVTLASEFI